MFMPIADLEMYQNNMNYTNNLLCGNLKLTIDEFYVGTYVSYR